MLKLVVVPALFLALTACMDERTYVDPNGQPDGQSAEAGPSIPGVTGAALIGDLGPVKLADRRAQVTGQIGGDYGSTSSSLQVNGAAHNGTGFIMLNVDGLDLKGAPAGTYAFNNDGTGNGDTFITAQGCSDTSDGSSVHFDGPAQQGTITLTDTDAHHRDVNVDATIPDDYGNTGAAASTASASFTLAR